MERFATLLDALEAHRGGTATLTFIEGAEAETTVSLDDLRRRALEILGALQRHGAGRGAAVLLGLGDNRLMLESFWACLYGGLVPVPLAVGATDDHRAKTLRIFERLGRPRALIDDRGWSRLEKYAAKHDAGAALAALAAGRVPAAELATGEGAGEPAAVGADDLALIQFSSGSTREPKGIRLSHENVITNMIDYGERLELGPGDAGLNWMPLSHDMGLIAFHLGFVVAGISHHVMPTDLFTRRPLLWLAKAAEKRATVLGSPNFGYKHYLRAYRDRGAGAGDRLDLTSVRVILNGAEPISVPLARDFVDTLEPHGLRRSALQTVYGLAEATVAVAIPRLGAEFEALRLDRRRLGVGDRVIEVGADSEHAVEVPIEGPPLSRCEARVVDGGGAELAERTVGHLEIRGPNVTSGFVGEGTGPSAEGWLDTGDLAFLDGGRIAITGRAKDIIFAFGQNYYPHDLEAAAVEVEGVELGRVAAVGHRPAGGDRDRVIVFVQHRGRTSDFAALAAAVAGRVNQVVGIEVDEVVPVRRIPRTTSGKLQRHALERAYAAGEWDPERAELAALRRTASAAPTAPAAASDPLETLLLAITAEVIGERRHEAGEDGVRAVDLDDDLFEIGLSSLDLAQIHERVDERHPGALDIMDLFDHPTLRQLAAFLASRL